MARRDPILIEREGSGSEPLHHLCTMCGVPLASLGGGRLIPRHYRRDILAELRRGDFDG